MKTFNEVMRKAREVYSGNNQGMIIYLSFCLGVMQSRMDKDDVKIMDDFLYTRQFYKNKADLMIK